MTLVSVAKQYFRLMKNVGRFTDGQVEIVSWDPDDRAMTVKISPNDGLYSGGVYEFSLILPEDFPRSSPRVVCETVIFHPNIDCTDSDHNVCISLFDEWTESNDLQDCIMGLLFLFYNPNLEDPLSPWFDGSPDEDDFENEVKRLMRGGEYDGFVFPTFIQLEDEVILDHLRKDEVGVKEESKTNTDEGYESHENEGKENIENIKNIVLSSEIVLDTFRHRSHSLSCSAETRPKPDFRRSVSEYCQSAADDQLLGHTPVNHLGFNGHAQVDLRLDFCEGDDTVFVENHHRSNIVAMSLDPLTPDLITAFTSVTCGLTNYFLHNVFHRGGPVT